MPPPNVSPQTPVEPTTPPGDEAEGLRSAVASTVEPPRARATSSVGVDIDGPHVREVDHETALDDAMAGYCARPTHGNLQALRSREVEGVAAAARASCDDGGMTIDQRVEADAGGVVAGIGGTSTSPASTARSSASRPSSTISA